MDKQIILACDDTGNFSGEYIPREIGHTGKGKRHLAVTVLIYNKRGQVLLQRRKHKVFDNIWCFSADTHPLHKVDGTNESFEDATRRALLDEYAIEEKIPLKNLGTFNYFAPYQTVQGDFCENEHCAMMVGEYNGVVTMNPKNAYEFVWMGKEEFLKDFVSNPSKYAPWVPGGVEVLEKVFI